MKKVYTTNFICHLKSLRYLVIGLFIIAVTINIFFPGKLENQNFREFMFSSGPILLIFVVPTFYLHLNYYIKNIRLKMVIDEAENQILMVQWGKEYLFNTSSIISIERHLGIYYRDKIDFAGRKPTPWTPYGYILLKLKNGSEFYITSLMVDINNPPLKVTHTYFRFFPYLKKDVELSEKRHIANENYENEISFYKSNFKHHSKEQLTEKIRNEKTYEKAAVEAARQLLKSKFETIV